MCTIIWLMKQLFIKLGWAKPSIGEESCGLVKEEIPSKFKYLS